MRSRIARAIGGERVAAAVLTILVLGTLTWLSLRVLGMPAAVGAGAPPDEFSSSRAMAYIDTVAERPHPIGSQDNARVRDYVVSQIESLGLHAEVQHAVATAPGFGTAGLIDNVLVRLQGTDNTRAVLIASHYDSVASGPGAGDDGIAVGAMLESLRAVKAGAPVRNDLIFLFSGGEEWGILGENAFVAEHPWLKDVGVVFTFDQSGGRGPLVLEKTSKDDGWVTSEIARAHVGAYIKSASNDTDRGEYTSNNFGPFERAGISGAHFDDLNGSTDYHNKLDNASRVDERKVQNYGAAMVRLARHFGNLNISKTRESDAVYFSMFEKNWIVQYADIWAWPLTATASLLTATVLALGIARRRLGALAVLKSAGALLLFVVVASALAIAGWTWIAGMHPEFNANDQKDFYQSPLFIGGIVMLLVAAFLAVVTPLSRRLGVANLHAGALVLWGLLTVVATIALPHGSYIFALPMLASALHALALLYLPEDDTSWPGVLLGLLTAAAVVGIVVPAIADSAIGPEDGVTLVAPLVLGMLALMVRQLHVAVAPGRFVLPTASAIAAIVLFIVGGTRSGVSADQPRPHTLFYALDADTGTARFATLDPSPDAWVRQFVPRDSTETGVASDLIGIGGGAIVRTSAALAERLAAPELVVLDDTRTADIRTLRLHITSPRGARRLYVIPQAQQVVGASVDGKELGVYSGWWLDFTNVPPEGIELVIALKADGAAKFIVLDASDGVPQAAGSDFAPEPEDTMPSPLPEWARGYPTFVRKTYSLN